MSAQPLLAHLRSQGAYCAGHGSPLYAALCGYLGAELEAGGPVAGLLAAWAGPDVSAQTVDDDLPALRLLGGLHRLVLSRQAPELALYFPSVGGTASPLKARAALLAVVQSHEAALRIVLTRAPQTNEVGRAAPLLGGLMHVAAATSGLPVRLFEIGASGGLNLRADRLPVGPGRLIDSPLPSLPAPAHEVVERIGGDLHPVDISTTAGRLTLTSHVWPDDAVRLERLRAALVIAAQVPAQLLEIGAADLVESIELRPGTVTVLWHSVLWQYLDPAQRSRILAAVAALGAAATPLSPLAYIRFERVAAPRPTQGAARPFEVRLSQWPDRTAGGGAGLNGSRLGTAPAHGVPVAWDQGPWVHDGARSREPFRS